MLLSLGKMGKTNRIEKFLSYADEHYGLWVTQYGIKIVQQWAIFQKTSFHIHFIFLFS